MPEAAVEVLYRQPVGCPPHPGIGDCMNPGQQRGPAVYSSATSLAALSQPLLSTGEAAGSVEGRQ